MKLTSYLLICFLALGCVESPQGNTSKVDDFSHFSKSNENYKLNYAKNLQLTGVSIKNVKGVSRMDTLTISNLIKDNDVNWFLRIPPYACSSCINDIIDLLKHREDFKYIKDQLIIITSINDPANLRQFTQKAKGFVNFNLIDNQEFYAFLNRLNGGELELENDNIVYFFMLDEKNKLSNLFIHDRNEPNSLDFYLKNIRLKK